MAKIYQKIEVEVSKPNFFSAIVAKQYDKNSRYLIATLTHYGEKIEVTSPSYVYIRAKRSDGVEIKAEGTANDDGTVTVPLTYDMLAVVGSVECEISIDSEGASTLTTTTFYLEVEESFGDGDGDNVIIGNRVRWCAMGDSITAGYTSYFTTGQIPDGTNKNRGTQDASDESKKTKGWVPKLAKMKNWDVHNAGVGYTGWVHQVNGSDAAWQVAEAIAKGKVVGIEDFKQFDIVTLMYGINDWGLKELRGDISDAFSVTATPTTIVAGMRRTIETIIASNPLCKIVVITPLNRLGSTGVSQLGEDTNWALEDTSKPAGSLEQVFGAIKSVCDYYGIEMIDMTHSSIANRKNLPIVMPDFVHPSAEAHTVIARELSAKINFR